jgi:hypothetical protein
MTYGMRVKGFSAWVIMGSRLRIKGMRIGLE